ncbi:MAG: GDP-mannose 4,6-dehydratase [Chitinophagaceae bacterium]|nr:GDP-mannose 4,6-dehydratase [Chitinophagaceae bacterium]
MTKFEHNYKILVTGGAGFIGSHLVDELLKKGYYVTVIDNLSNGKELNLVSAFNNERFEFFKGDILDKVDINTIMKDVDYVFHLACLGVRHSLHSPFENHQVNTEGTLNVLHAALVNNVKHVFYISTSEIYGRTDKFPITEFSATSPLTIYGSSKLAGEHYAHSYRECFGLKSTVLRIFNNYGSRAHYEGDAGEVIPRSIVRILSGEPPILFGDGSITRDFFYVEDTAKVLTSLISLSEQLNGETINIGTGIEITMKSLMEKLLIFMGRTDLSITYLNDRPADVPRLWVDNSKFQNLIKFKSDISFDLGLMETIKYYENLISKSDLLSEVADINWNVK